MIVSAIMCLKKVGVCWSYV